MKMNLTKIFSFKFCFLFLIRCLSERDFLKFFFRKKEEKKKISVKMVRNVPNFPSFKRSRKEKRKGENEKSNSFLFFPKNDLNVGGKEKENFDLNEKKIVQKEKRKMR